MSKRSGDSLWIERGLGPGGVAVWMVSGAGREACQRADVQAWLRSAEQIFTERTEVASVSVITDGATDKRAVLCSDAGGAAVQARSALMPFCFVNDCVADLVGLDSRYDRTYSQRADFQRWMETATLKGLVHVWLPADVAALDKAMSEPREAISLGIDAAWLLGGESGAQVFVFEMLKELARRPEIGRMVLISQTGRVPRPLEGVPKVSGVAWSAALANTAPLVDIIHRPYQPGADVDYRRYHQVAGCVAITVLDFIAYDNPAYHASPRTWRQYQASFDENVCLADGVFAISRYVGTRLERQFGHALSGPVRCVPLGTDHLPAASGAPAAMDRPAAVSALDNGGFLLVLGNDFEHKNRDFAVTVFATMRDRGYEGQLVLAGFHLDAGSSYDHELSGAGRHASRIVRLGAVSGAEKTWLLSHADAVLYPTSSEGFGLVPFEAAALETPTAFVRFGPLRETLPGVDACAGWQVRGFADHVFGLIASPATQVEQIRAAGAALTWTSHVDQILEGYQHLLSRGVLWRKRTRGLPGPWLRASRTVDAIVDRATSKLRRLAGRSS